MQFKKDANGNLLWELSSWGDFLEQATVGKSCLPDSERASRSYVSGHSQKEKLEWDNALGFEGACNMALSGDIETASKIETMATPILEKMTSLIERVDIVYSTEGQGIDIARVVENEPECWMDFAPSIHAGKGSKIVSIYYNSSTSVGITSEQIKKKGMAVLVLVEALEMAGFRTEIHYCSCMKRYNTAEVYVKIKEADQMLDRPRLAFIIANSACYRRLNFSIAETCADKESLENIGVGSNGALGYGYPGELSRKGDIYIGRSIYGDTDMTKDPEGWVKAQLEKQGIKLDGK